MSIIKHNVFEPWPLKDQSVQAIITSPPYWGKRCYDIPDVRISDEFTGQHGLEPTVEMYINNSVLWLSEALRVLRDDGILFINISDTYGGSWGATSYGKVIRGNGDKRINPDSPSKPPQRLYRRKSLLLIPERLKVAMYEQGWYFRNNILWVKSNCIPDSAGDRFAVRHEDIIFCSKSPKYYFDLDAVRVPYKPDTFRRNTGGYKPQDIPLEAMPGRSKPHQRNYNMNPKGANPGDVWTFATTKNTNVKHYAMYPEKLVERMIKCSSREGDIILDPFMGSGTTALVSAKLGRRSIGFDLGYEDVQRERLGIFYKSSGTGEEK